MISQQILSTVMACVVVDKNTDQNLTTFYLFYTAILQITKEIFVKIC